MFDGIRHMIFIDFGVISGPYFESFFGTEAWHLIFCLACFQVTFRTEFDSKFQRSDLLKLGFRMDFGVDVFRFLTALEPVFLIFAA